MSESSLVKIDLTGHEISSLSWVENELVDIAGGFKKISAETGEISYGSVNYAYRFDCVAFSSDGAHAVLFEKFGTKAVLLKHGQIVREINRSFYHANVYEYPITFISSESEPVKVVHCPDDYNVLQIEDFETGEIIAWKDTEPDDFFHSRLQVSPDGCWLLSAGWIWHPLDAIEVFDLSMSKPKRFTPFWSGNMGDIGLWEVNNASFLPDSTLLMSGTGDQDAEDASEEISLVLFNLKTLEIISRTVLGVPTGPMFPLDAEHVLTFYEHPRLINIGSGSVVRSWPEIATDKTNSSICFLDSTVKIAVDTVNRRFAVANAETLTISNIP
ncbi:MAG: hypothetical protein IT173_04980 [Acidobacteria bacterium]|nr:hypothetical protein [Acidobacteriota bacterium]